MTDLKRLRDSSGPAGVLMTGAKVMRVPSGARRRAVAFTGAAAGLVASSGVAAAAGTASLIKTFVVCVGIGAAGGGVMSLAASETVARLSPVSSPAAPVVTPRGAKPAAVPFAPPAPAAEAPLVEPALPVPAAEVVEAERAQRDKPASGGAAAPARVAPAPPTSPGASLFEEQRFIESARAAVARGDAREALSKLDAYERTFANRQFGPEALALRIEALRSAGQVVTARKLAEDFARLYPRHPLLGRVQSTTQR